MAFYIRRLNKISNWPDQASNVILNEISADAISELRTSGNNLSWWKIEKEADAQNMAASMLSIMDMAIGTINIVLIPENIFNGFKITQSPEDGKTAIFDMEKFHYNMSELNYKKLGEVAEEIANHIAKTNGGYVKNFKSKKIIEDLIHIYQEGKLNIDKLGDYAKKQLSKKGIIN